MTSKKLMAWAIQMEFGPHDILVIFITIRKKYDFVWILNFICQFTYNQIIAESQKTGLYATIIWCVLGYRLFSCGNGMNIEKTSYM